MFIKELEIKNFKNIESRKFKFNRINLLTGNNGQGKSSILESLVFLLTNTLDGKMEEYIRWGEKGFNLNCIMSDLLDNKIDYSIESKGTTKRELIINDDRDNIYLQSDAVKYIKSKIDSNIALYSNISIQGKSTQLLSELPTPRLEKLKMFFGVNDVDRAVEDLKNDISEKREKLKIIESELLILREKTFDYLDEEELEDYSALKNEVDILKVEKEKFDAEIKLYNNFVNELELYNKRVIEKKSLSDILELNKKELEVIETNYKDIIDLDRDKLKDEHSELKTKFAQIEKDKKDKIELDKKIIDVEEEILKYQKEHDDILLSRIIVPDVTEEKLKDFILEKNELQKEYLKQQNQYDAIKDGKCDKCGAEYNVDNINDVLDKLNIIKIKLDAVEQINIDSRKLLDTYKEKLNENEIKKNKKESLLSQIETLTKSKNQHEEQLSKLNVGEEIKDDDIRAIETEINRIDKYNRESKKTKDRIKEIEINLKSYSNLVEPEKVEEPKDFNLYYFEDKKKDLYVHIEKQENLEKVKKLNEKTKEKENENIKIISEKETSIDQDRRDMTLLESTRKILSKDFSSFLIDKGTNFIKSKMNEIFSKSYGKYNVTLSRDNKGVDFYYSSQEKNILTSVNLASGYEKQLLSVAFRFSLANLHKLGIFIFDEIDSDSSEENSLRLFKTIMSQNFKQLFIVSHKENTKEWLQSLQECSTIEL